jgi:hypothetical protein
VRWNDLLTHTGMWSSPILTVTNEAKEMFKFLIRPLPFEKLFSLNSLKLISSILLPSPIARQYGILPTTFDIYLFCFLASFISLVYGLCPSNARCFTQFLTYRARINGQTDIGIVGRATEKLGSAFMSAALHRSD